MNVPRFSRSSIRWASSPQPRAKSIHDLSMPLRNDLRCRTWDPESDRQEPDGRSQLWMGKRDRLETVLKRVLVVEDSEPFREFICSTVRECPGLRLVGEASDGLQGVRTAEELQADLIVLDIGVPSLNGIAAARQIRKVSPKSKILFVSQESSIDVVEAALATGAQGYIVKTDAGREFVDGVNAVLRGEQFLGKRFSRQGFIAAAYPEQVPDLQTSDNRTPLQQYI